MTSKQFAPKARRHPAWRLLAIVAAVTFAIIVIALVLPEREGEAHRDGDAEIEAASPSDAARVVFGFDEKEMSDTYGVCLNYPNPLTNRFAPADMDRSSIHTAAMWGVDACDGRVKKMAAITMGTVFDPVAAVRLDRVWKLCTSAALQRRDAFEMLASASTGMMTPSELGEYAAALAVADNARADCKATWREEVPKSGFVVPTDPYDE